MENRKKLPQGASAEEVLKAGWILVGAFIWYVLFGPNQETRQWVGDGCIGLLALWTTLKGLSGIRDLFRR
jgi:hypothetical protein